MSDFNLVGYKTIHLHGGTRDDLLKEKRKALGLTQQQVADKAKIKLPLFGCNYCIDEFWL